jgi:phosphatidylethanolamine-binding protein (PEBP) family uncharacterized protein
LKRGETLMTQSFRRPRTEVAIGALTTLALLVAATFGGCGESRRATAASARGHAAGPTSDSGAAGSPEQGDEASEHPPLVAIDVEVPALTQEEQLPRRYTCDGEDRSLGVRWSGIPADTAELALFIVNTRLAHGELSFAWAVVGLSPRSHGIPTGALPPGAIVGRNSLGEIGYSICPRVRGREENYIVRVIALPHAIAARPGFDAGALYDEAERSAEVVGVTGVNYTSPDSARVLQPGGLTPTPVRRPSS